MVSAIRGVHVEKKKKKERQEFMCHPDVLFRIDLCATDGFSFLSDIRVFLLYNTSPRRPLYVTAHRYFELVRLIINGINYWLTQLSRTRVNGGNLLGEWRLLRVARRINARRVDNLVKNPRIFTCNQRGTFFHSTAAAAR